MASRSCGLQDSGTLEYASLYYKCLSIGHVWVHTISLSGNGYWSPSQKAGEFEPGEIEETALDELWNGIKTEPADKFQELSELLNTMNFDPQAVPQPLTLGSRSTEIQVWWAA